MTTRPTTTERRARAAVAALFLTNGALFANLVPRYPQIKDDLGLGNAVYGLAVAAFPAGALLAGLAAGVLVRRFGSARVAVAGTVLTATTVMLAGASPSLGLFALALLAAGGSDAITDVAQNAHGLRVQRRYRRSIINSFHALWSAGAVLGGVMAAGAIAAGVPRGVHLAVSGVVFAAVALVAYRFCLPGADADGAAHDPDQPSAAVPAQPAPAAGVARGRVVLMLAGLVVIGIAACLVEDAGTSWATLYLSTSLGAPAAIATTGYIALAAAQFVGRAVGDRFVDRFGQRTVARAGGLLIAGGMGAAVAFPTVPGTILGFAAAGFGVATLGPAAMQAADELPGLKPGTGLTIASWLMRIGFLASPPLVGLVADATSLRVGLLVFPAAGVVVLLTSACLQNRAVLRH
ncbi:MFS transporter [Cellulomonas triticagri]|uniref:MFS transporter n=1 Tax=Cellulomonas triticagri TaxID=2483352 RepID=A0A3M2J8R4_9CELL|nr:MFS transporter [Cellulomonas triticagri]